MDFSSFKHAQAFESFFAHVSQTAPFDVLTVPPDLWENLYLLEVRQDGGLIVRLAGAQVRDVFGRDLRGLDLRQVSHGGDSARVTAAYDQVVAERRAAVMRRRVHLPTKRVTRVIECGFAPLFDAAAPDRSTAPVNRILGCFFALEAGVRSADYGKDDFALHLG
ncbi:MAG: PAS domain-containing protein [Marivibrio sp.]|uniref:PAS domain-containing protein n=1 Tax=Marivibrio sp. TaxID=2039719 RepID=UPI0032EB898D